MQESNASGPLFCENASARRCFGAQDRQVLNPSESQKLFQPDTSSTKD